MKMAMIFPGQNYQNIYALLNLSKQDNIIKNTFLEASDYLNYNIWKLINKSSRLSSKKNIYIQPIILISSVAIYRLWKKLGGINPVITSGHSLGEYSALVCSNTIKFSDALKLIKIREYLMQKTIKNIDVQMQAIIGLNKNIVFKICKKNSKKQIVNIASINPCNQIIISGHKNAVQKTSRECKQQGAKQTIIFSIQMATHCSIMKKIKRQLFKNIKKISIQKSDFPIINSISLSIQRSQHTIKKSLIKQLYKPVRWEETMHLIQQKSHLILEVGTNNILTKLNKNFSYLKSISINTLNNINLALKLL